LLELLIYGKYLLRIDVADLFKELIDLVQLLF
jgi:hypothetical protein